MVFYSKYRHYSRISVKKKYSSLQAHGIFQMLTLIVSVVASYLLLSKVFSNSVTDLMSSFNIEMALNRLQRDLCNIVQSVQT